ncbi:MAG: phage portal protein [Proteobacteria bacterium]|nr:phage portal protein [Pseudomonadota bacterium]
MLDTLKRLLRPAEQKMTRIGRLIALENGGRARWTPRDYAALTREGFGRNAIVYRAVRLTAEAVGGVSFLLYDGAEELTAHPLIDLLARPNPRQDGPGFLETIAAHLMLSGNAYVEAVRVAGAGGNVPRELYALRPDRMKVVPGPNGWPAAFDYTVAGQTVRYAQDGGKDGPVPPILHLTLFNPLDDYYGLSPLEAAAIAVDTHNAAANWNKALLDNAARPSGALVYAGADGTVLSETQFERLKTELAEQYQGAANAGRPLVLEGGLDWKAMSLSPKDMDFMEAKHAAAREIALAFGVPPMLLAMKTRQRRSISGARPARRLRISPLSTASSADRSPLFSQRSPARRYLPAMPVSRITAALIILVCSAVPGAATLSYGADRAPRACLTKIEQREAIAAHHAIPLAEAIRAMRARGHHGEVVRASLCRRGERLVYELTVLARSGKVIRAHLDAADGRPLAAISPPPRP